MKTLSWSYGITTVVTRFNSTLPKSIASLKAGGFDKPRLFIDCCTAQEAIKYSTTFGLELTARYPAFRTFANWLASLQELYLLSPTADRYALFQDDVITYKNLRGYLEGCEYPPSGYLNLYTFPEYQELAPKDKYPTWFMTCQGGKGALALVMSNEAVRLLLTQRHMIDRPFNNMKEVERNPANDVAAKRVYKSVDGAIVTAFNNCGWKEYAHNPYRHS